LQARRNDSEGGDYRFAQRAGLRAERDRPAMEVMMLRDGRARLSEEDNFTRLEGLLRTMGKIYEQAERSNQRS